MLSLTKGEKATKKSQSYFRMSYIMTELRRELKSRAPSLIRVLKLAHEYANLWHAYKSRSMAEYVSGYVLPLIEKERILQAHPEELPLMIGNLEYKENYSVLEAKLKEA